MHGNRGTDIPRLESMEIRRPQLNVFSSIQLRSSAFNIRVDCSLNKSNNRFYTRSGIEKTLDKNV